MSFFPEEKWINWVDVLSENDFLIIDEFISDDMYHLIRSFFHTQLKEDEFRKAAIGAQSDRQIKSSIRGDFIYWLYRDRDKELLAFFDLIDEVLQKLNRYCFLSLSGSEFHLAYYPKGTHYEKHVDQFRGRNNRLISLILYLNEGWKKGDGGELKIFREDGPVLIEPIAKRCVIFKSDVIEHEVLTTKVDRYSLTGWLLHAPSSLGYLLG